MARSVFCLTELNWFKVLKVFKLKKKEYFVCQINKKLLKGNTKYFELPSQEKFIQQTTSVRYKNTFQKQIFFSRKKITQATKSSNELH